MSFPVSFHYGSSQKCVWFPSSVIFADYICPCHMSADKHVFFHFLSTSFAMSRFSIEKCWKAKSSRSAKLEKLAANHPIFYRMLLKRQRELRAASHWMETLPLTPRSWRTRSGEVNTTTASAYSSLSAPPASTYSISASRAVWNRHGNTVAVSRCHWRSHSQMSKAQ